MNSDFIVAVHALVFLNHKQGVVSSEALAENVCTNAARVRKVMAPLKRAGLVETREGNEGGYRFAADPVGTDLASIAEALGVRRAGTAAMPTRSASWPPAWAASWTAYSPSWTNAAASA